MHYRWLKYHQCDKNEGAQERRSTLTTPEPGPLRDERCPLIWLDLEKKARSQIRFVDYLFSICEFLAILIPVYEKFNLFFDKAPNFLFQVHILLKALRQKP